MVNIQIIGLTSSDIQSDIRLTQILKTLNEIQLLKKSGGSEGESMGV